MENNLDKFYSEDSIETWKTILGEDMHYHHGYKNPNDENENPMEFCVRDIYPLIKEKSTILDCGAGWGGPAKMFQRDLLCDVSCLTISKSQSDYLKSIGFKTFHVNFDFFIPTENYDYAIFFESLCHSENQMQVFKNLSSNVNAIIVRDCFTKEKYSYDYPDFKMQIHSLNQMINNLESVGFRCKVWSLKQIKPFISTIEFWKDRLSANKHLIKGEQLNTLYKYITYYQDPQLHSQVYKSGRKIIPYLGTIYATK